MSAAPDRVLVPAGPAVVGADRPLEGPEATVDVGGFGIDRLLVSNGRFAAFIDDGGYTDGALWSEDGWAWAQDHGVKEPAWWHDDAFNGADHPVTGVSFHEAEAYARWCGGRLPCEVEWEKAARGTDGRAFPWGDREPDPDLAVYAPGFVPVLRAPAPVTSHAAGDSPYGCRHMAGNLFEWTVDFFHPDTPERRTRTDWVERRPADRRVLKGGAWTVGESRLRCAARYSGVPGLRDNIVGLRVAYDEDEKGGA